MTLCFSATASFSVAAVLLPVGLYSVSTARQAATKWMPLAIYPLAFSIQQALECVLWLGVTSGDSATIAVASRGFLFFSHFFWLAWVPYSAYCLETETRRRKAFLGLTAIGSVYGLSLFLPAFSIIDWLSVELVKNSLDYKITLIYDGFVSRTALRAVYALIVVSALVFSSDVRVKIFGGLIVAAQAMTYIFFAHAFISVWCFFAAALSVYIATILADARKRRDAMA